MRPTSTWSPRCKNGSQIGRKAISKAAETLEKQVYHGGYKGFVDEEYLKRGILGGGEEG
jgi:hypothetical protein